MNISQGKKKRANCLNNKANLNPTLGLGFRVQGSGFRFRVPEIRQKLRREMTCQSLPAHLAKLLPDERFDHSFGGVEAYGCSWVALRAPKLQMVPTLGPKVCK